MANDYLEQLFGLRGQVAVVIGGTGVLGSALSEALARAGADVVVAGRGDERGQDQAKQLAALGVRSEYIACDAGSRESVQALLDETLRQMGRADMLVNCAGVNAASPYFELTDADWDRVFDVNLKGTHYGCQVFGQHMAQAGGGSILNIGSVTADIPLSRVIAYGASKAAVVNLTQNIARELAPFGVRANTLCPGFFPAEQNRAVLDAERIANILDGTPMHRFGEPHELAGVAILLLSRAAGSYITGATYYADGGFTAMRF